MMKSLVVDIGNTSTSLGVVAGMAIKTFRRLATRGQSSGAIRQAIYQTLDGQPVSGTVLCSVVPGASSRWLIELRRATGCEVIQVGPRLELGISLAYPRPETLGPDRIANVCGAVHRYGVPVIAIDIGTATTFDVVAANASFIGGAIAPGPSLITDYMAERTAMLPRVKAGRRVPLIGRTTADAMRIAATVGYRGMMDAILRHLLALPGMKKATVCVTGGHSPQFAARLGRRVRIDPFLTLRGLGRISSLNPTNCAKRQRARARTCVAPARRH